jgi:hypothetical protein
LLRPFLRIWEFITQKPFSLFIRDVVHAKITF